MNASTKLGVTNGKMERFSTLRSEFTQLTKQFKRSENIHERRYLVRLAQAIAVEAKYLFEQNRLELENKREAKQQNCPDSPDKIVPFRTVQRKSVGSLRKH